MQAQAEFLYGDLTARIRKMLEPVAHDSFLFFSDTVQLLEPEVNSGDRVLDAGSGRGTVTTWLADRGCTVHSIDSSPERVEQTRRLVAEQNLESRVTVERSPLPEAFPADHYDVILDCFSWWHISDWGRLLNASKRNLGSHKKLIILDTFFYWKTTLDFRREMLERWQTALPTYNECRNMLIKREFRILKEQPIQPSYIRYLDAIVQKIGEFEKEGLGDCDPGELKGVKEMWEWFRRAAHEEELFASLIVAELN